MQLASAMRAWGVGVVVVWVAACSAACSTGGPPEARLPRRATVGVAPPRGVLVARMEEDISTSEHAVGKRFGATLAAQFTDEAGSVHLAPGARLVGTVTSIHPGKGARPGVIELRFEELIVSRGERYRLDAPVTAADVQQGAPELEQQPIRAGVIGGILVGSAFGNATSVLLGAGFGSAAGVARAARERVVDARVAAKSFVTAHVHAIDRER